MAEQSKIEWCDSTFNSWIGCTKVSQACDHCYAEAMMDTRMGRVKWGAGQARSRTSAAYWKQPLKWNTQPFFQCGDCGWRGTSELEAMRDVDSPKHLVCMNCISGNITPTRRRVFCASLADVFDNQAPDEWRADLWQLLRDTPNLRWMLLTKRIGNAAKMLPVDWPFPHVGLMATMVNQTEWDRDFPKLAATPAAWRGVSVEPMLGPIIIGNDRPDWIITGGESGPNHRRTDPAWVRLMRDQCKRAGIAFHHKQWGGLRPKANGCLIDGQEHKAFPASLAA